MPIHPNAPQCTYTKVDGVRCGGPAKDGGPHCHHHAGLKERFGNKEMSIPPLDDQNAIQVALMDVIHGLLSKRIDRGDAYTVLYAIQIAKSNLKGLTLVPPSPDQIAAYIAEQVAAAKAELKADFQREYGSDYDENGEPVSLSAILLKELRDSADFKPGSPDPSGSNPGEPKPAANVSGEPRDPSQPRTTQVVDLTKIDLTKGEWWTEKKTS